MRKAPPTLKRGAALAFGALCMFLRPGNLRAQAIDSVVVGLNSRYHWRGYDRGNGALLRTSASLALGGFSTSRASGEPNNWTADVSTWNALTDRDARGVYDQYELSAGYGRCLAECDQNEWGKRTVLGVAANSFLLPNSAGRTWTGEVESSLRSYIEIEQSGAQQLGINLVPYLQADYDFHLLNGVYLEGGIGTYIGPTNGLGFFLTGSASASTLRSEGQANRSLAYHNADVNIGIDRDQRIKRRHLSTRVIWNFEFPSKDIGKASGTLIVRLKLSGPVLKF
jgi:hypothetical protein